MRRTGWAFVLLLLWIPSGSSAQERPVEAADEQVAKTIEHRVAPGETLWSISRAYFGDPFMWRQILEANQDRIEQPEWIEPGLLLVIPGQAEPAGGSAAALAEVPGAAPSATAAEGRASESAGTADSEIRGIQVTTVPRGTTASRAPARPVRAEPTSPYGARTIFYTRTSGQRTTSARGSSRDRAGDAAVLLPAVPRDVFYTAGWLIPVGTEPEAMGTIVGFAGKDSGRIHERETVYPYDRIRLSLTDGATAREGDQFMTVTFGREIEHVGQVLLPTGVLTVTRQERDGVVAVLAEEYGRVDVGDHVVRLPSYPLRAGVSAAPTEDGPDGRIVTFQHDHLVQSLGSVAYIDLGEEAGIRVGDEFEVFAGARQNWDGDAIGRLQVVGVHADHSAARIIRLDAPLFVDGLRIHRVARMP